MRGAEPGDVLEIDVVGYETDDFGWTAIGPARGSSATLRPALPARWELDGERARSEDVPGVAVPAGVFAGVIGVAPSPELFARALAREADLAARGGEFELPSPELAVPPSAAEGLGPTPRARTAATSTSATSWPAADCSCRCTRPAHCSRSATSTSPRATRGLHLRHRDRWLRHSAGEPAPRRWRPRFPAWESPPRAGRSCFATTGIPLDDDGRNEQLDLNLATRRALLEMLDWLEQEHGMEREPAYVLMSAAVELRVSELVDTPNALVSPALPLDVFEGLTQSSTSLPTTVTSGPLAPPPLSHPPPPSPRVGRRASPDPAPGRPAPCPS